MQPQPDLPVLSSAALRVLREDQPSDHELSIAYRRFTRLPRRRSTALVVACWVIAGLVMGLGVAFGSEAIVEQLRPTLPAQQVSPSAVAPRARPAAAPHAPLTSAENPPETATVEPAAPLVELKAPRTPTSVSPKASAVSGGERPPADSAVWAKAAAGLRNDDIAETQAALATLEHASSAADREAARLIRAQLMLHQGDASGARALLQDLADHAESAAVRSKARSLLTAASNSALNAAPSGT